MRIHIKSITVQNLISHITRVRINMGIKKNQTAPACASPVFDENLRKGEQSGEGSPMGSNVFIVKSDSTKINTSHADPFRHEPVTQQNFGRSILRGIRCKCLAFLFYLLNIFSTLGNTTN